MKYFVNKIFFDLQFYRDFFNDKSMKTLYEQFTVHYWLMIEKICHKRGCTTISWEPSVINKKLLIFSLRIAKYFPNNSRLTLLIDYPKRKAIIGKALLNKIFNSNDYRFINFDQLSAYVDENLIPLEKGGNRYCVPNIPPYVLPLKKLKHFQIPISILEKFEKYHENHKRRLNFSSELKEKLT